MTKILTESNNNNKNKNKNKNNSNDFDYCSLDLNPSISNSSSINFSNCDQFNFKNPNPNHIKQSASTSTLSSSSTSTCSQSSNSIFSKNSQSNLGSCDSSGSSSSQSSSLIQNKLVNLQSPINTNSNLNSNSNSNLNLNLNSINDLHQSELQSTFSTSHQSIQVLSSDLSCSILPINSFNHQNLISTSNSNLSIPIQSSLLDSITTTTTTTTPTTTTNHHHQYLNSIVTTCSNPSSSISISKTDHHHTINHHDQHLSSCSMTSFPIDQIKPYPIINNTNQSFQDLDHQLLINTSNNIDPDYSSSFQPSSYPYHQDHYSIIYNHHPISINHHGQLNYDESSANHLINITHQTNINQSKPFAINNISSYSSSSLTLSPSSSSPSPSSSSSITITSNIQNNLNLTQPVLTPTILPSSPQPLSSSIPIETKQKSHKTHSKIYSSLFNHPYYNSYQSSNPSNLTHSNPNYQHPLYPLPTNSYDHLGNTSLNTSLNTSITPSSNTESISPRKTNVLHRNKACLSCRARKTKCDAIKPVCSSCKRLGPAQQSQCRYDQPPKWLESVVSPAQRDRKRVMELEKKLEGLERRLSELRMSVAIKEERELQQHMSTIINYDDQAHLFSKFESDPQTSLQAISDHSMSITPDKDQIKFFRQEPSLTQNLWNPLDESNHSLMILNHEHRQPLTNKLLIRQHDGHLTLTESNNQPQVSTVSSPTFSATSSEISLPSPPRLSASDTHSLSGSNWSPHLPSLKVLKLLVKAFFNRPFVPFMLVDPAKFQARLDFGLADHHFPEPALIHAICAMGAQYISKSLLHPIYWSNAPDPQFYHIHWAERLLSQRLQTVRESHRLLELSLASVVCSQFYIIVGKPMMMWKSLGFCSRICTLLGLNVDELIDPIKTGVGLQVKISLWPDELNGLDRPLDNYEKNNRSLLWWYAFCCDRMSAASGGFAPTIDENDSLIPIFYSEDRIIPEFDYHFPASPLFFMKHEQDATKGPLQLLIKAAILSGKVTTTLYRQSHPAKSLEEINRELDAVSSLIKNFLCSIPPSLRNPLGSNRYSSLNICLTTAHTLIHASLIQLHEDQVKVVDLEDRHLKLCAGSARVLINWFREIDRGEVDTGHLLCGSAPLHFALSVTLRTQCRLIAFYEKLGQIKEAGDLRFEIKNILIRLERSHQLPMAGRMIGLIKELLQDPTRLLPNQDDIKSKSPLAIALVELR
ncbi:hypothetical protein O181_055619 [Austropuccinia psidii MF-1]|uniref:Zn(2)-C6 fungal-type domain-containing protein n=1 Tax=Austropuccinia psidii MF-1 TaxID=1389203 RepID=A0A9Q3HUU0_9BASI|nr:hypothetical protein [Austropuccinia psidii MF-1]